MSDEPLIAAIYIAACLGAAVMLGAFAALVTFAVEWTQTVRIIFRRDR